MSGTRGPVDSRLFKRGAPPQGKASRGALAPPTIQLAPLEGIGTLRTDLSGFEDAPYVRAALELLRRDPLPPGTAPPSFESTRDSARYGRHLDYLVQKEHKVLEILGFYNRETRKVKTQHGDVIELPPIGVYSAVFKESTVARAIFNLAELNEMGLGSNLKVSICGGATYIARLRRLREKSQSK